jgi:hypothetical protein
MTNQYLDAYPYLDALVGGWFHQDFDLDGGSLEEVIASYKARSAPDDRLGAKADIQRLLRNTDVESLEERFNRQFSPSAYPGRFELSMKDWLVKLYHLL